MRLGWSPLILLFPACVSWALECNPPSKLKQETSPDHTSVSWCESADGVKNGPFERSFSDGRVNTEGTITDGKMSGLWTRYWDNGRIRDKGPWRNDHPVGDWKFYDTRARLVRETQFDDSGKITSSVDHNLRTSERWRLRAGLTYMYSGDNQKKTLGPQLGGEYHLYQFGRWLRTEAAARILPDYNADKDNYTYAGELQLALEPIPYWLDPFALSFRVGPHWTGFNKSHFSFAISVRYVWQEKQPGFHVYGAYVETGGSDDQHNGGYCQGGPGMNGPCNGGHGGANYLTAGVIFSL